MRTEQDTMRATQVSSSIGAAAAARGRRAAPPALVVAAVASAVVHAGILAVTLAPGPHAVRVDGPVLTARLAQPAPVAPPLVMLQVPALAVPELAIAPMVRPIRDDAMALTRTAPRAHEPPLPAQAAEHDTLAVAAPHVETPQL